MQPHRSRPNVPVYTTSLLHTFSAGGSKHHFFPEPEFKPVQFTAIDDQYRKADHSAPRVQSVQQKPAIHNVPRCSERRIYAATRATMCIQRRAPETSPFAYKTEPAWGPGGRRTQDSRRPLSIADKIMAMKVSQPPHMRLSRDLGVLCTLCAFRNVASLIHLNFGTGESAERAHL